ncbi:MAG: protein kinase [Myxococcaceae bacterium]|jgi:serine/threonine protein kinase|nr:protein kinase [Myxococcaceae bacterium]MCA3013422.1 protein kinase [Myxococcaceae bacterium]
MTEHLGPAAVHGFIAGALSPQERAEVTHHLDTCSRCRTLVSALAREGTEAPEPLRHDAPRGEPTVAMGSLERPPRADTLLDDDDAPAAPARLAPPRLRDEPPAASDTPAARAPSSGSTAAPTVDRLIGQRLGDYVVTGLLAEGGMGAVYRGVQPVIGKQVAIKVLLSPGPSELEFGRRLLEEARTVNAIKHANIIDIYTSGELPDGRPWLVMEYLDGSSIAQWVHDRGQQPLPLGQMLSILEQCCAALEAAHAIGVVHRDLKPANVMLTHLSEPTPRVKVLDFGLAKSRDTSIRTSPELVLGTPGYMSPEQIRGEPTTPRCDLYALGLIAHFIVTGHDAFRHKSPVVVMHQQLKREPPALHAHPGVPVALAELIADLTRLDPTLRPSSAQTVRARLRSIANGVVDLGGASAAVTQKAPFPSGFDVARTEPDRQAVSRPHASAPPRRAEGAPAPSSPWPWVLAVVGAVALGLGTWFVLR